MYCWNEDCPARGSLAVQPSFASPGPMTFQAPSPGAADTLIGHLGLRRRTAAAPRELYSPWLW